eukprot:CAMPEP_0117672202 /NCGR_PEP_ID=MMETSP0804-20121206/13769_1 /TAXON_ID=1074897 /ORGANISM="Tetraselmis astigmatica, Strain CCMP880" /LENGTH=439 /DNA_ID=CAMNT_0005480769 /DNA_START=44 /DNA_END=1360 /DNA_ORIENTATION=+
MATVWNMYSELHDLKARLLEGTRRAAEEEWDAAQDDAEAFQTTKDTYMSLEEENAQLRSDCDMLNHRIVCIETERDDYLRRMVEIEDSVSALTSGTQSNMLKNFTLKKFVDVITDKVTSHTKQIQQLQQLLQQLRFHNETVGRKLSGVASALADADKLTAALPETNSIRSLIVTAVTDCEQCIEAAKQLDVLNDKSSAIVEGGEDTVGVLAAQGLDRESFYALVKTTVGMFRLDTNEEELQKLLVPLTIEEGDEEDVFEHLDEFTSFSSPLERGAKTAGVPRPAKKTVELRPPTQAEIALALEASIGNLGSQPIKAASRAPSSQMALSRTTTRGPSRAISRRASFAPSVAGVSMRSSRAPSASRRKMMWSTRHFESIAYRVHEDTSNEAVVDMTDVVDSSKEDCLKEIARLRRHLIKLEISQGRARSRALSRAQSVAPA